MDNVEMRKLAKNIANGLINDLTGKRIASITGNTVEQACKAAQPNLSELERERFLMFTLKHIVEMTGS